MTKTTIYIVGQPQAALRPRILKDRSRTKAYYPKAYKDWKQKTMVYLMASRQIPSSIIHECECEIIFVFKRLKKHTHPERVKKFTTPDNDNLEKAVWDILQDVGVLSNDGKIWRNITEKWYAAENEQPHIEITITHNNKTE